MPVLNEATDAFVLDTWGLQYDYPGGSGIGGDPSYVGCPIGHSPNCYNVMSYPGRVGTRFGFTRVAAPASDPVSIKEFVQQDATTRHLLMLGLDGALRHETGSYSFSTISSDLIEAAQASTMRMNSNTLFGREYMAFAANGLTAVGSPYAYDGTNLYRVSPAGPGSAGTDLTLTEPGAGSIAAGVHQVRVCFLTSWGYITPPCAAFTYTASGSKNLQVAGLPLGPPYVVARIICASAAGDLDLYYVPDSLPRPSGATSATTTQMVVYDNTTTSVTVDFTDDQLAAGVPISVAGQPDSDLLNVVQLPAQATNLNYHGREVWIGERSTYGLVGDSGPRNFGFNGGWATNRPHGWTEKLSGEGKDATPIAGATSVECLKITGDGTTQRGLLENAANFTIIPPATQVRARARLRKSTGATGTFHLIFNTSSGAGNTAFTDQGIVNLTSLSNTEWRVIDLQVLSAANNAINKNWTFRISGGVAGLGGIVLNNGGIVYVDWIELYNGAEPSQPSLARISRPLQPDAYDALTGFQYIDQDDGQRATGGFVINETLYYVKERSLHATRDDGAREPAYWTVSRVSENVGTPSAKGIGRGDNWVVIAGRSGLYYFDGGRPIPLTDNCKSTWNSINWQYASSLVCRVDMDRKRIYVAAPRNVDTAAIRILMFQWTGNSPAQGVEFCLWDTALSWPIYDMCTSERSDGTRQFLLAFGNAVGNNGIVKVDESARGNDTTDAAYVYASNYQTAFFGTGEYRMLVTAVRAQIRGSGTAVCNIVSSAGVTTNLPNLTMSYPNLGGDNEFPVTRFREERAAFNINCNNGFFELHKLSGLFKADPYTSERKTRN